MIEVRGLTKRFGEFTAVDNVSFTVGEGETFALLGPNGSGKTTTLKCLVGLSARDAGSITINGLDISRDARAARRALSYLPQRVAFHESLTAREVLEFYCRLRKLPRECIDRVLDKSAFNFNGFADKLVGEFSGGMLQRLGVAVAFLPGAPVLVLDEPTISLDPEGALRFRRSLAALKEAGRTIIFASHVLADVEILADRVGVLVGGRMVAVESIDTLRRHLLARSRLRVVLPAPEQRLVRVALEAGATQAELVGNDLLVASRPEQRLSILRAVEDAGAQVLRFSTQEPALEEIYLRYVHEKDPAGGPADGHGVPHRSAEAG